MTHDVIDVFGAAVVLNARDSVSRNRGLTSLENLMAVDVQPVCAACDLGNQARRKMRYRYR